MKIASWNINSVKARMPNLTAWLESAQPDVVCLQEIKTVDDGFPRLEIEALGYHCSVHGQKSYNGVAILSRVTPEDVRMGLPGDESDEQARYIEIVLPAKSGTVRVGSIYLPNGNPIGENADSEKYLYKLDWMRRLKEHAAALLKFEEPLILAGDYNVIPRAGDCHDPKGWEGDAAYRPETAAAYRAIKNLGLYDAFETLDGRDGQYTFWDYQRGAWQNNLGIRIDHLLCSGQAMDRLTDISIDKFVREATKPSDHVPIIGTFEF